MQRTVTALDARRRLGELLESVYLRGDEVVIERAGKPIAVVIPADRYESLERYRERLWKFAEQAQSDDAGPSDADVARYVEESISQVGSDPSLTAPPATTTAS